LANYNAELRERIAKEVMGPEGKRIKSVTAELKQQAQSVSPTLRITVCKGEEKAKNWDCDNVYIESSERSLVTKAKKEVEEIIKEACQRARTTRQTYEHEIKLSGPPDERMKIAGTLVGTGGATRRKIIEKVQAGSPHARVYITVRKGGEKTEDWKHCDNIYIQSSEQSLVNRAKKEVYEVIGHLLPSEREVRPTASSHDNVTQRRKAAEEATHSAPSTPATVEPAPSHKTYNAPDGAYPKLGSTAPPAAAAETVEESNAVKGAGGADARGPWAQPSGKGSVETGKGGVEKGTAKGGGKGTGGYHSSTNADPASDEGVLNMFMKRMQEQSKDDARVARPAPKASIDNDLEYENDGPGGAAGPGFPNTAQDWMAPYESNAGLPADSYDYSWEAQPLAPLPPAGAGDWDRWSGGGGKLFSEEQRDGEVDWKFSETKLSAQPAPSPPVAEPAPEKTTADGAEDPEPGKEATPMDLAGFLAARDMNEFLEGLLDLGFEEPADIEGLTEAELMAKKPLGLGLPLGKAKKFLRKLAIIPAGEG